MGIGGEWADMGDRVRESRLAADLSQDQLAAAVGLDRTMIAKIEAGVRRIDALELVKLSAALDVPLDFLLRPAQPIISRRAELTDDTIADVTRQSYRLELELSAWLADVRQLAELGDLVTPPVRRYPGAVDDMPGARSAARWVRDSLDLGTRPISSLMTLCERMGQLVAVVETRGDGASLVDGDVAVAVVSSQGDPGRRRATAAHELGHLIVGDEYSADLGVHTSRAEREQVIDAFAAELLLPAAVVKERTDESAAPIRDVLMVLAATYRTSWSLAVRQALEVEAVDREAAQELRRRNPTRAELMEAVGWTPQPDLESVRVPPSYAHAVFQALKKNLVTTSRAIELMRGQVEEADLPARDDWDIEP